MLINFLSKNKNVLKLKKFSFTTNQAENNHIVTPWQVEGKVDYNKLIQQFGTEIITDEIQSKFERIINKPLHPWIKRGIFFTHRGLDNFLSEYEKGSPVFLYTGRGPSSEAMHLGHLVPFIMTKWLQETFDCPLVIQISDEEKSAFKQKKFNEIYKMGFENAKDIISCGFKPDQTFIFSNRDYRLRCRNFELMATEMKNATNLKEIKKIFGFDDDNLISMYEWPFYQTAAAYYNSYPHIFNDIPAYCLVPHAIDQDPYFRLARDLSNRLNLIKPHNIMSKFIPSLRGQQGKMSSSTATDFTIFLNDTPEIIKEKVMKHSFSGGGGDGTISDHRKFGGNPDIDVSFQYLTYFEYDDEKLLDIRNNFISGHLTCHDIKLLLLEKLLPLIENIQENKRKIDDSYLNLFYLDNPLKLSFMNKNVNYNIIGQENKLYNLFKTFNISYHTFYHEDIHLIHRDTFKENELKIKLGSPLCKTLLLKGHNKDYFMLIVDFSHIVNIKDLKKKLNISRLNYAEKETVKFLFNDDDSEINNNFIFSAFSLINYKNDNSICNLNIIIQKDLIEHKYLNFHPMRPDASVRILKEDLKKFVNHLNYSLKILEI